MPCIFCRIVSGNAPSRTVFEDETTMAFLDVNPLARGHTLVVPKEHYARLNDLPDDLATDLLATLYRLVAPVEDAVEADASTIAFNNGQAAGQEIPHVHAHIVPRFRGDGGGPIHAVMGGRPHLSDEELNEIRAAISRRI